MDKVSLSSTGIAYLVKLGVDINDTFGLGDIEKYKGKDGVYNSSGECYVAYKIFKDYNFKEIYCVCSPAQVMRKAIRYIYTVWIHTKV